MSPAVGGGSAGSISRYASGNLILISLAIVLLQRICGGFLEGYRALIEKQSFSCSYKSTAFCALLNYHDRRSLDGSTATVICVGFADGTWPPKDVQTRLTIFLTRATRLQQSKPSKLWGISSSMEHSSEITLIRKSNCPINGYPIDG